MTAMELTEQDLKAIRQMVRFEIRWATKRIYDRMTYDHPPPSPGFSVVGVSPYLPPDPGPVDMKWVEEPVAKQ